MLIYINEKDTVYVTIKVTGNQVVWSYKYYEKDKLYSGNSDSSEDGVSSKHALGLPSELNRNPDNWSVFVTNMTDNEQNYGVSIEWQQGASVIATWNPGNSFKLTAQSMKSHTDEAIILIKK